MIRKIRAGIKLALGKRPPGPELPVFPDDVFLIAYPKSGNTWTRFLVANLLYSDRRVDFLTIPQLIPHFDVMPKSFFKEMPRPRIINCAEPYHPHYQRVIYVVRDPRDVAVSLYYFKRKRRLIEDSVSLDEFVSDFIRGKTSPPRLGSWGDNAASWLTMRRNNPNFLLVRYEDMISDTAAALNRIAAFLGASATSAQIATAVERSSAQQMRSLEKAQGKQWHQSKGTRQDIPFVRSAQAGGWKSALSQKAVAQIESAWGPLLDQLGYERGTESGPEPASQANQPQLTWPAAETAAGLPVYA
jgi:hypothetical protein